MELGVEAIITDRPAPILALLDGFDPSPPGQHQIDD
jgi:hypothetical protein